MGERASQTNQSRPAAKPRLRRFTYEERRSIRAGISLSNRQKLSTPSAPRRPVSYQITFDPLLLPRRLYYVVFGLLAAHLILAVTHFELVKLPWLLRQLFDLDEENNLPSWYSGITLFITAIFLWLCSREKRAIDDVWGRQWKILAAGFFFLSLDEIAGLHETFNSLVAINWAIPGAVLTIFLGFLFLPFLLHLEKRTARMFAVAGFLYFGGAIGVELLASSMRLDTLQYYMMTFWEEGMEMIGVLVFLSALLSYMSGQHKNQLKIETDISESSTDP